MDELISRTAALDAIVDIDCSDGVGVSALKCDAINDAVIAIQSLPPVQLTTRQKDAIKMADALFDAFERAQTLLKAAYDLLNKQEKSHYVLDLLEETVFYDDAECDGSCLMDDIKYWFDEFSETDLFGDER